MKRSYLSHLLMCSLFSAQAWAAGLPHDLADLDARWNTVLKTTESEQLMSLENIDSDPSGLWDLVQQKDIDQDKDISSLHFQSIQDNTRTQVLRHLFPNGDKSLAFCESFPKVELNESMDDGSLSPEELEDKEKQANFSNCRRQMNQIIGGILYANPKTHLADIVYQDGHKTLSLYVQSLINPQRYLHYKFVK